MKEVRNLDQKRVCDISDDGKEAYIKLKDCVTVITVGRDGKLVLKQLKESKN